MEYSGSGGLGPGSNNPALRKKQRPLRPGLEDSDDAAVTVEPEETDSHTPQHFQLGTGAAGMQVSVPGKRGGRTANAGRKAGPRSRALFGGA